MEERGGEDWGAHSTVRGSPSLPATQPASQGVDSGHSPPSLSFSLPLSFTPPSILRTSPSLSHTSPSLYHTSPSWYPTPPLIPLPLGTPPLLSYPSLCLATLTIFPSTSSPTLSLALNFPSYLSSLSYDTFFISHTPPYLSIVSRLPLLSSLPYPIPSAFLFFSLSL